MKPNKYIQTQENFVKREQFVLNMLKFFFDSKRKICGKLTEHFTLVFSDEVKKAFHYSNDMCPDHCAEFLEEVGYAIEYGHTDYKTNKKQYICIEGNGIFSVFALTKNKRKRITIDQALKWSDYSNFEGF